MYERVKSPPPNWLNDRLHFFKYMTADTAKKVLKNRTLRFSRPDALNDPFDMGFDLNLQIDKKKLRARVLDALWDAHFGDNPAPPANNLGRVIALFRGRFPKMDRHEFEIQFSESVDESLDKMDNMDRFHDEIREFMKTSKVLCLTESPDNPLMWAHYADSHRGVCIRFRSIPEKDSMFGAARAVNYVDAMPSLLDDNGIVSLLSGSSSLDQPGLHETLIYTKSSPWAYEKEWRIAAGMGWDVQSQFEDLNFGPDELDAIIFGSRSDEITRSDLISLARLQNLNVRFYVAEKSRTSFELQLSELHV